VTLNDCLSLYPVQALNRQPLSTGWRIAFATLGEGEDRGFSRVDFDDDSWAPAEVPRLHAATAGHETVWYRVRFPRPRHRQRTLLRFEGAFLVANVWLNGRLLGSHYGYFAPFSFDVSSFLLEENVLAVCVETPVELDLAAKRHVLGIFGDWDCKPYPSRELGQLPEDYTWQVPIGLWQPVLLEQVGHVVAEWVHCDAELERADVARLAIRARLRNLDGRIMTGEVQVRILCGDEIAPLEMRRAIRLPAHGVIDVTMELALPSPRPWWPHSHGSPSLYRADLSIGADEREAAAISKTFGIRDVRLDVRPDGWVFHLNGRALFPRGANYVSEFFLDSTTAATASRDLELARAANMDMLRVHAHLEPEVVYAEADTQGMLLWQDFPLIFSYAHRADARAAAFFREAVLSQVEEMVHLLYDHPSVVCYAIHHAPSWCDALAFLGERHLEQLNRDIDEEAAALARALDPARPAFAASGDRDQHLTLGWEEGHWRELAEQRPTFVSQVGAQALPSANSPVWRSLNARWPVADDDPSWRYAGYQPNEWARSGIGLPSSHPSRDACIRASQEYQAHLLRFAIERFRAQKFADCGGVLVFQLVDGFPGVTKSILDHARRPKRAYHAVREAFAPVLLVAELPEDEAEADGLLIRLPRGRPACLRVVCINDDPNRHGVAQLRWRVSRRGGPGLSWWRRLRARFARRRFRGETRIELPESTEPASVIAEPVLRLQADGLYRLTAELESKGELIATLDQPFLVGDPPRRGRRLNEAPEPEVVLAPAERSVVAR
jgi:beta-mannosidase